MAKSRRHPVFEGVLHDNLKLQCQHNNLIYLPSRTFSKGGKSTAVRRFTFTLKFTTVGPPTLDSSSLPEIEYIDGKIHFSTEPECPEDLGEPLELADSYIKSGKYPWQSTHDETINPSRALKIDHEKALERRKAHPRRPPTGGFVLRGDGTPVVGEIGRGQWLRRKKTGHARTDSGHSSTMDFGEDDEEPEEDLSCACEMPEVRSTGSGTDTLCFTLLPYRRESCKSEFCNVRPYPRKTFRLAVDLLTLSQPAQPPAPLYAHFHVSFYFKKEDGQACCRDGRHRVSSSIRVDVPPARSLRKNHLRQSSKVDSALRKLEGNV